MGVSIALCIGVLALSTGCGGDNKKPTPTVTGIEIDPATPSIAAGTTQQLTATATYSDMTTKDVTATVAWSSADSTVATVSASGLATGVAKGSTMITATLQDSGKSVTGTVTFTVSDATLTAIAVTPTAPSIAKGTTQQLTATGTFSDNTTQDLSSMVTWSSSDTTIATVDNTGLATGAGAGSATITATLGSVSGNTSLTVTAATMVSIAVTPTTPSIAKGTTQQFTATATFSDTTTQDVTSMATWSSSDSTIATVDTSGLATGVAPGSSDITAAVGSISGSTTLTVTAATLVSIAVTPTTPSIAKGTQQQFAATGTYTDGSTQDLTSTAMWSSSDTTVATVSNADGSNGLADGVGTGSADITATVGTISGSTTLTVSAATLVSIAVTPTNPSIAKGTSQQFTATGTYTDSSTQDLTAMATWASSDTTHATVSNADGSNGLAVGVGQGTSTISASVGTVSGSSLLTVSAATLVSLAVTPTNPSIAKGTSQQFTATGTYTDNSKQDLTTTATWTSSTTAVATVSNAAGSKGLATSLATGSSNIKAAVGTISDTTKLTVTPAVLASISVTPSNPSIAPGTQKQFTATGVYTDGTTQPLTTTVTWSSSDTTVATISNAAGSNGLASAAGSGTTTISAKDGTITGSTVLTVTNATLVSIAVTPSNPSIAKGTQKQFIATGTFSDSSTQDISSLATWTSSDTSLATVSNAPPTKGLATGVGVGAPSITATFQGVNGSTTLTVTAATLVSIAVTPSNPSIAKGTSQQFTATGTYTDSSTQNLTTQVTWASADTTVATISNAAGSEGLASGVGTGSSKITATLGATSGSTTLKVTPATLVSIAVTPTNPSIAKGTQQQFAATGTYSDGTTQDLTTTASWASTDNTVATVSNTAGSNGLATGTGQGSAIITATVGGVAGSTTLAVTAATLVSIQVTPTNPTIAKGTTKQFAATGTYTDNSTQDLTTQVAWASSNTAAATVSSAAGSQGLASGVAEGSSTITATLGTVSGSSTLTVTAAVLTSITVTPVNPSIAKGTQQQFAATGTYSDNTTQDLTETATWSSSDSTVADVSNAVGSQGLATGDNPGSATITATSGAISGSTSLTVTVAQLVSIQVAPNGPSIASGLQQQFTATGTYTDKTTQDLTTQVTWASSNTTVATISNAAGSEGLAQSTAPGTSDISATLGTVTGTTTLTVTNATLVSVAVTPTTPSIAKGTTQQFKLTGTYTDTTTRDLTTQATWTSSDTTLVIVSNANGSHGLATGVAEGTATITGTFGGQTDSTTLTVTAATLVSIAVTPANPSVFAGFTQQFRATGTYTDSTTQDITTQVTWSSSDETVAIVSNAAGSQGLATAVKLGTATITATSGTKSGSTAMTVINATQKLIGSFYVYQGLPYYFNPPTYSCQDACSALFGGVAATYSCSTQSGSVDHMASVDGLNDQSHCAFNGFPPSNGYVSESFKSGGTFEQNGSYSAYVDYSGCNAVNYCFQ